MIGPIMKRLEALEANGKGNDGPMLLIVQFLKPADGEADPVGINAAPPYFPQPVDRFLGESWEAFKDRLEGMLSHLPGGSVVCAFSRASSQSGLDVDLPRVR